MTKKWPNIRYSLLALIFTLTACPAVVREDVQYKYNFKKDSTLSYDLKLDVDAAADAVVFQYNGKIGMSAVIELSLKQSDTPYGNQIQMVMKDLNVNATDPRVKAALMMGMNYFRSYFSHLYLTDQGRMTVLYLQKPQKEFTTYAAMLFPDFSDMESVWKGTSSKTNINLKMNEQKLVMTLDQDQSPAKLKEKDLLIYRQIIVKLYDEKDYAKSVEPQALAAITVDMNIFFDTVTQELKLEDIDLDMSLTYRISQGILSQTITGSATGDIVISRQEEAAL